MMSSQMNKYTPEKGLEWYTGEILKSLPKHLDVCLVIKTKFFYKQRLIWSFVQSIRWFHKNLQTFKN